MPINSGHSIRKFNYLIRFIPLESLWCLVYQKTFSVFSITWQQIKAFFFAAQLWYSIIVSVHRPWIVCFLRCSRLFSLSLHTNRSSIEEEKNIAVESVFLLIITCEELSTSSKDDDNYSFQWDEKSPARLSNDGNVQWSLHKRRVDCCWTANERIVRDTTIDKGIEDGWRGIDEEVETTPGEDRWNKRRTEERVEDLSRKHREESSPEETKEDRRNPRENEDNEDRRILHAWRRNVRRRNPFRGERRDRNRSDSQRESNWYSKGIDRRMRREERDSRRCHHRSWEDISSVDTVDERKCTSPLLDRWRIRNAQED